MEKEIRWLLYDEDFKELTNTDKYSEWALFIMWNNGITSPEDSQAKIELARFQHSNPDCPFCGAIQEHYVLGSDQYKCKKCLVKFSMTSRTFIHDTKLEYHIWWRFAYLVGDMKITNSQVIAKDLGVTQKTSWGMIKTLRTARKRTSDHKFANGQEVLVFNHLHEVLEVLLKQDITLKEKEEPELGEVLSKTELLKQIYEFILSQKAIQYKEEKYGRTNKNSLWDNTFLRFKHNDISIEILKRTRTKSKKESEQIGELVYILCAPTHQKAWQIKKLLNRLTEFPLDKSEINTPDEVIILEPSQEFPHQLEPIPDSVAQLDTPTEIPALENLCTYEPPMVQPEPTLEEPKASDITEKQCKRKDCLKVKPISEFHKGSSNDGLASYCKECSRKVSTESNSRIREKDKARAKKVAPSKPKKEKHIINEKPPEPDKSKAIEEYKRKNILNFLKL